MKDLQHLTHFKHTGTLPYDISKYKCTRHYGFFDRSVLGNTEVYKITMMAFLYRGSGGVSQRHAEVLAQKTAFCIRDDGCSNKTGHHGQQLQRWQRAGSDCTRYSRIMHSLFEHFGERVSEIITRCNV